MASSNFDRCETVEVNGVIYNKGDEPKEVSEPKKRGPKKKVE